MSVIVSLDLKSKVFKVSLLPLRPFTFFVYCRMRSLILGLSVGRSVGRSEKKKSQKKKKMGRSLELGGLVPQHNNMQSLEMDVVKIKREQRKKK